MISVSNDRDVVIGNIQKWFGTTVYCSIYQTSWGSSILMIQFFVSRLSWASAVPRLSSILSCWSLRSIQVLSV